MTLSYLPGRTFRGQVNYILPQVDAATRTLKVRIEFDNPDFALKPDMYGEVEFQTGGGRRLMVPQTAVLNSGDRQVVFVDRGNGYFEPREVKMGARGDGRVEMLSGLERGERIVTSGNFLIDSESQLKAAWGARRNDRPNHRALGAEPVPGVPVRGGRVAGGLVVDEAHPAGRHSRPERYPGDRLLALGPQPGHHGGPGHLPDRERHAGRAEGERRARLFRFRVLVRLHHFRRGHRHLLGALADAGVSLEDSAAAAEGREDGTRAGCDGRGLGVSVRAGGAGEQPRRAAQRAGLVPALSPAVRAGRGGSRAAGRVRAAVSGERGSQPAGGVRRADCESGGGGAQRQQRCGRTPGGVYGARVHGARARLRAVDGRSGIAVAGGQRIGRAGPRARCGERDAGSGYAARRCGPRRAGRSGLGHHRDAAGRERAAGDRAGEGEDQGDRARPARRHEDGDCLRPLRADSGIHRQSEAHADGRADRGGPGDSDLPVARSQRHHSDRHDSDRGDDLLHSDARDGHEFEHHVAGRHRDCGGRDGGRRHRGGGADAQETGGRRARTGRCSTTSGPS